MTLLQTSFMAFFYFSAMYFITQYGWRWFAIKFHDTTIGKGVGALVF